HRTATGRGDGVFRHTPSWGDPPDPIAQLFYEPKIAVWAAGDAASHQTCLRGDGELGDLAGQGDPSDLVAVPLGEPKVAIRTDCDSIGVAQYRRNRELGDLAGRGDPPDVVTICPSFGEPEVAIWITGDARDGLGCAFSRGERILDDLCGRV